MGEAKRIARQRVLIVTGVFAGALLLVADLAWATSLGTPDPWFSAGLSMQTYSVWLIASTILALGLLIVASIHVALIGNAVSALDRRVAVARGRARSEGSSSDATSPGERDIEDELDEVLGTLEREMDSRYVEMKSEPDPPVVSVARAEASSTTRGVLRELAAERRALGETVSRIRWAVAGPIVAALGFMAIAGAMLPASEGFAEANFRLNTFFILFLSYGWPILVGWTVTAIAISRRVTPR